MAANMSALEQARERARQRELRAAARPRIDYDAANKLFKAQKAALTRASNSGDPEKVVLACQKAVREWNADHPCAGAWPDHWSNWQRALDDALPWNARVILEDLA